MAQELATKLRLTAAALGCTTHKELCARFRAVNPVTEFDDARSQKWLQGRAHPRNGAVYADWAKVLGTSQSGAWLAECTLPAFEAELVRLFGTGVERSGQTATAAGVRPAAPVPFDLTGQFACYSFAWSPYYRGQLIRGAFTLARDRRRMLRATYSEYLLGATVCFVGEVVLAPRTLHALLRGPAEVSPLLITMRLSGPPGSVLCGIMAGATAVGPEPLPSATRIVAVRVPRDPSASNRYFALEPGAIASDLLANGLRLAAPERADAQLRAALERTPGLPGGMDQTGAEQQAALAMELDGTYLEEAERAQRTPD
jgi:hypothetical protein